VFDRYVFMKHNAYLMVEKLSTEAGGKCLPGICPPLAYGRPM